MNEYTENLIKFHNEFKDWTKEEVLTRAFEIMTKTIEITKERDKFRNTLEEIRELLLNFNNGVCIKDGKEKPAFTKALDFDETRNLLWNLLQIIDKGVNNE